MQIVYGSKKIVKYLCGVILIQLLATPICIGQDAFFNQYFSAKLFLNPALASAEDVVSANTNYRAQWKSNVIPYKTSQVSVILPFINKTGITEKHGGGVGFSVYNDNAGDGNFNTIGAYGTYSFNFPISYDGKSTMLAFGLQAGIVQKRVDFTNFQWGSQYVPFFGYDATDPGEENLGLAQNNIYPDFSAGFMVNYNGAKNSFRRDLNYHFGAAIFHLNTPDESFFENNPSSLPRQIKAHGGLEWKLKEKIKISPNALYIKQGDVNHINMGCYLSYQVIPYGSSPVLSETEFIVGSWYRLSDSFIFLAGLHNNNITFGFSYDLNGSNLRSTTQGLGAYEISFTITRYKKDKLKKRSTPRI